jgi:hypothetical protein
VSQCVCEFFQQPEAEMILDQCAIKQFHKLDGMDKRWAGAFRLDHVQMRHVLMEYLPETRDNHSKTVRAKLRKRNDTYQYWQQSPAFPHPVDFNPFALVMSNVSFDVDTDLKDLPSLSLSELRGMLGTVTHIPPQIIFTTTSN